MIVGGGKKKDVSTHMPRHPRARRRPPRDHARGGEIRFMDMSGEAATLYLFALSELGGRQSTWSASRRHPASCSACPTRAPAPAPPCPGSGDIPVDHESADRSCRRVHGAPCPLAPRPEDRPRQQRPRYQTCKGKNSTEQLYV